MADTQAIPTAFQSWRERLDELERAIAAATRRTLLGALEERDLRSLARAVGQGRGDMTFALDVPAETAIDKWFEQHAAMQPLSLLTEDRGWRHRGPDPDSNGSVKLDGFDHGGPRIAIDPIDGTRSLTMDLRPAWTLISFADPGADEPRMSDLSAGLAAEIPNSRGERSLLLCAERGRGATLTERNANGETLFEPRDLRADEDDRVDHGFFPFFRYTPDTRPALAQIEAEFFARLEQLEGADTRNCWDDQYIASTGQLVQLCLGSYRSIVDLRPWISRAGELPRVTSKPYDLAGAVLIAREAGCVVEQPDGAELDFPIDTDSQVAFAGFANAATAKRLRPHLHAVLAR